MSVSFDNVATLQSATSHQCSRDADGHGVGGRNGYPSDSVKAVLTEKYYVAEPEDHDQTRVEEFDSGEAPCPTSEENDSEEEEADSSDGEGAGATIHNANSLCASRNKLKTLFRPGNGSPSATNVVLVLVGVLVVIRFSIP